MDTEAQSGRRRWGLGVACLAVVSAGATVAAGCAPLREWPWDYPILLDGAWRVTHGQIPHTDFYAPIDAFPLLVYSAGMKMAGSADALAWGASALALVLFATAWYVARTRLSNAAAYAFTAMTGLLVIAPRTLGFPPTHTSYAMHYNRIGWALVSIAVLLLLPRRRAPDVNGQTGAVESTADGILSGLLCGLLIFTKINYLLAAVCTASAFAVIHRRRPAMIGAFAAGFAASAGALLAYLRFDVASFLRDIRMVAANASVSGSAQGVIDRILSIGGIGWNSANVLSLAAFSLWLIWRSGGGRQDIYRVFVAPGVVIPFGVLICSTNAQNSDIPLIAVAMLLTAELFARSSASAMKSTQVAVSLLAILLTAWIAVPDMVSIGYSFAWNATAKRGLPAGDRIQSATMQGMPLPRRPYEAGASSEETWSRFAFASDQGPTPHQYMQYLNAGITLLRPHVTAVTRVVCLDVVNPFSFALGLPPARGGALYWHYGLGFTDTAHPDA